MFFLSRIDESCASAGYGAKATCDRTIGEVDDAPFTASCVPIGGTKILFEAYTNTKSSMPNVHISRCVIFLMEHMTEYFTFLNSVFNNDYFLIFPTENSAQFVSMSLVRQIFLGIRPRTFQPQNW